MNCRALRSRFAVAAALPLVATFLTGAATAQAADYPDRPVKIITQGGQVTLKGPVKSEDEKNQIASKAAEVAGQDKVTDQLSVKQ